ncbi:MAG: hypothetical protein H7174_06385 [Flavobacterium sp.]|nr:hypothetical protein [Flavobacterium sp.]
MKKLFVAYFLFIFINVFSQKPCEISTDVKDSIGTYKTTKDYLVFESNFSTTKEYVYFYLANTDGTPTLNVQFINKSSGFIKAKCIDKNSKLYFKLQNGNIVTLIPIDKTDCGTLLIDDKKLNTRVLAGSFLFLKGSMDDLKKSPISFMKIKLLTETKDYVFTKNLKSEMDSLYYEPENYFINFLHCIE